MTRQRCGEKWADDTGEDTTWHTCVRPPAHPGPHMCACGERRPGDRLRECGPLSRCARTGHIDSIDHQPGGAT